MGDRTRRSSFFGAARTGKQEYPTVILKPVDHYLSNARRLCNTVVVLFAVDARAFEPLFHPHFDHLTDSEDGSRDSRHGGQAAGRVDDSLGRDHASSLARLAHGSRPGSRAAVSVRGCQSHSFPSVPGRQGHRIEGLHLPARNILGRDTDDGSASPSLGRAGL